jgi:CIC family chloride channel protein
MQIKKLLNLIKQINLTPYYKAFMLWRLKHLTEYQFVLILSLVVGLFSGFASVVLKNTLHFTYNIISGFSWFSADRGNILFLV